MPYAAGTVKCAIGGDLAGGEVFSYNLAFRGDASWDQTRLDRLNGAVAAGLENAFLTTAVRGHFSPTTKWQSIRCYLYTGGTAAALISEQSGLNLAGTAAPASLPNQIAEVVTLLTGLPGRRYRGRLYLPPMSVGVVSGDGQNTTAITDTCEALRSMIQGIKDLADDGAPLVVASLKNGSMRDVSSITIDSRFDVQRRRAYSQQIDSAATANIT
jgi:hypothetical protein